MAMNFLQEFALLADLPGEGFLHQQVVEMIGDNRVLIENHYGIVAYGCNEISVKTKNGFVHICGEGLELVKMTKEQLVIIGNIFGIKLQKENV